MAKKSKSSSVSSLPSLNPFYYIPLDNEDYQLTLDVLNNNTDPLIKKRSTWFYPAITFINFSRSGILKISTSKEKEKYVISIKLEKNKIGLHCSCKNKDYHICTHVYGTFDRLLSYGNRNFLNQFTPKGIYETAIKHKKYFQIKNSHYGLEIINKLSGCVYNSSLSKGFEGINNILNLRCDNQGTEDRTKTVTYLIIQPNRFQKLPILLPCEGKLNKEGTNVIGFDNFPIKEDHDYSITLTENQKALNKICFIIRELSKDITGELFEFGEERKYVELLDNIYTHWKTAVSLLESERFLYKYWGYRYSNRKQKAIKKNARPVKISSDSPQIHFQLSDKGDYQQLVPKLVVRNKILNSYISFGVFFIHHFESETVYMLPSIRDIAACEFIRNYENKVNVFKEHRNMFKQTFLDPLKKCYQVISK
ncbi:hypothetical protein [Filimonas effusa]|uniref:SWIM-type domain-containing protein n=1 Tax=Filimonas effusa TaxID=2508721 RepID=A0A4V1MAT8_9BACT|nr:hypothetical protein [Filimonas effusa]RXK87026.1 hypothetical protein ESB13_09650 [Filimonas effusa]